METITLEPYQKTMMDFIISRHRCGIFSDPGTGKTLTTLAALTHIRPVGHILLIAPLRIARSTWGDEIEKWGFSMRTESFIFNEKDKQRPRKERERMWLEALTAPPTFYFMNKELIPAMVEFYEKHFAALNQPFYWPFPNVIIDEVQGFKDTYAVRSIALAKTLPFVDRLIELTGTPSPNGLVDIWNPIYMLDGGLALGSSFDQYLRTFFHKEIPSDGRYVNPKHLPWKITKSPIDMEVLIHERIKDLVISVKNANLVLPPVIVNDIRVHLTAAERKLYQQMKTEAMIAIGTDPNDPKEVAFAVAENAAGVRTKLLQIANGNIYTDEEQLPGQPRPFVNIHDHKLDMVEHLVNSTSDNVLIFYHFQSDRDAILSRLAAFKPEIFDASKDMKTRWNNRQIRVMMIHPASAGHGHNIQDGSHTIIWYGIPDNAEHYIQATARLARQGQKETVIVHRLITAGTVDAFQPARLAHKVAIETRLKAAVAKTDGDILKPETMDDATYLKALMDSE